MISGDKQMEKIGENWFRYRCPECGKVMFDKVGLEIQILRNDSGRCFKMPITRNQNSSIEIRCPFCEKAGHVLFRFSNETIKMVDKIAVAVTSET